MKRLPLLIAVLAILAGAIPLYHWIAASDATTMAGGSHEAHALHGDAPRPEEGGQSTFAAIAEIVALLEEDPDTDWSTVDITALREHLVDMNSLMLNAKATTTVEGNTIRFRVEGEGAVLRAIQAMVPAHAAELDKSGPWSTSAELTPEGAILLVKSATEDDLEKARALGFFGLMAKGSHHQPHHLAMARGMMGH
ncbi:hypothetical protein [Hoeflea alexandrii]|nr:hypothetical protein [Hoeflea alexandrii]MCY0152977.1 hypothetical protein [Hoeflea alexandrii]